MAEEATLVEAKKMQGRFDEGGREGDGGSDGEEAYKSDYGIEKRALTRRRFVKTSAAFGAAVAGIPPYNLTDIADIVLKEDGELIAYPFFHRFINKIFQVLNIKLLGCNWNCRWCVHQQISSFRRCDATMDIR